MSAARITTDGLWRCLCPSIDSAVLRRVIRAPLPRHDLAKSPRCHARPFHSSPLRRNVAAQTVVPAPVSEPPPPPEYDGPQSLTKMVRPYEELQKASVQDIFLALDEMLRKYERGHFGRIAASVKHLVTKKGVKPTADLYHTLLLANCDYRGSATAVATLLKEMDDLGIEANESIYQAALQALSVHPDPALRSHILQEMKTKWISHSSGSLTWLAVGLIREEQFELALDTLDDMTSRDLDVPPWLFDTFIYTFAQAGHLDEALRVMQYRLQKDYDVDQNLWYFLLDRCSSEMHYYGTNYVWNRMVNLGILDPPDGTVLNVLNTASRHGDSDLAMQAVERITARRHKIALFHYEALVECYLNAADVTNAIRVMCIMFKTSRVKLTRMHTRCFFQGLRGNRAMIDGAVKAMFELKSKADIPLAILDTVLEAEVYTGGVEAAMGIYRHIKDLCKEKPQSSTFKYMLVKSTTVEMANFIMSEMEAFGLKPSAHSLDSLIWLHAAKKGSIDTAFEYLDQLDRGSKRRYLTKPTVLALAKRCLDEEDSRVWGFVDRCRTMGLDIDSHVRKIVMALPKEKMQSALIRDTLTHLGY